ncbi:hypothetical protein EDD16DRAFT_365092 [Pisolithus croceorrhizus]|nr:hypothetical protein EDD16DRAFT_365092 [Pisolithus croceorrhizus]
MVLLEFFQPNDFLVSSISYVALGKLATCRTVDTRCTGNLPSSWVFTLQVRKRGQTFHRSTINEATSPSLDTEAWVGDAMCAGRLSVRAVMQTAGETRRDSRTLSTILCSSARLNTEHRYNCILENRNSKASKSSVVNLATVITQSTQRAGNI